LEKRLAGEGKTARAEPDEPAEAGVVPPPVLTPAQDLLLHLLVQRPDLRGMAADDLQLEANAFPAPWNDIAGHLLLNHTADLHALSMLDVMQREPVLHAAVYRWASSGLDARVPSVSDPAGALAEAVRGLRQGVLAERLQKLTFTISEAERARDFARAGELSREKRDVQRQLADLRGHSGLSGG
jgi:hypothetical protein